MLTVLTFGTLFKMRGGEIFFRDSLIEKNELEKKQMVDFVKIYKCCKRKYLKIFQFGILT